MDEHDDADPDDAGKTFVLVTPWLHASAPPAEGCAPEGLAWAQAPPLPTGSDSLDHWFRVDWPCLPGAVLEFPGLATRTEVWLDGVRVAEHASMFRTLWVTVPETGARRIEVVARALSPGPGLGPMRPRPRWRNRLVANEAWRSVRTSVWGRVGGSDSPVVGPFVAVTRHPRGGPVLTRVRTRLEDGAGLIELRLSGPGIGHAPVRVHAGGESAELLPQGDGVGGTLRIPEPALWWPHTHGEPCLHAVHAELEQGETLLRRVGFRTVERAPGPGFALRVNGVPVFCRGALWSGGRLSLERMLSSGLNMLRVPGSVLPSPAWLGREADRLGIMVWQDFSFARFDYPATPEFLAEAAAEAAEVLEASSGGPSLAVLCGGDEVAQAAAMAGRPAADWAHPLFDDVLAQAAAAHRPDVPYVPNAPWGGVPPFAASAPVAHYFGVGAYLRPLHEAAGVRFAAACLAFSNPPDAEGCRAISAVPGDAAWAARVPRDPGASWTFEDARDHYAATLFGVDMAAMRRTDPERWLSLGRSAVAIAMQTALTTWRCDPDCGGALVLAWNDDAPGPGWGLTDHAGRPKSALHAVAQVSQPVQVLLRDAGLDGVMVHVFNERPMPLLGRVSLRGLSEGGEAVPLGTMEVQLPEHGSAAFTATEVMGRFVDIAGAWRFGPAPYRVLGAQLFDCDLDHEPVAEAILFLDPALPRERVGLSVTLDDGFLRVASARFAQFVAIDAGAHVPGSDHFHLWPGEAKTVWLAGEGPASATVSALNGLDVAHFRGEA